MKALRLLGLGLAGLAAAAFAAPGEWAKALAPRAWSFPRDLGAHPAYRTEWWYFSGNLRDREGRRYGYHLAFFRQGVRREPASAGSWAVRDLYVGHRALADQAAGLFRFAERLSRAGPGLAGAAVGDLDLKLLGWTARRERGGFRLAAVSGGEGLELTLAPRREPVVHGRGGVSAKGPAPGQASYYASITSLETRGTLTLPGRGRVAVTGTSWLDQEFGSNQLSKGQTGWDWLGLHLSDGRELMLYRVRRADGSAEPASGGTLVEPAGARPLALADYAWTALGVWKSPKTGARYPSRWRVAVPSAGLDLALEPLLADQECDARGTVGFPYWEGAVTGRGTARGLPVACEGFVELTGYGASVAGRF